RASTRERNIGYLSGVAISGIHSLRFRFLVFAHVVVAKPLRTFARQALTALFADQYHRFSFFLFGYLEAAIRPHVEGERRAVGAHHDQAESLHNPEGKL